jgi:hypothetical protein
MEGESYKSGSGGGEGIRARRREANFEVVARACSSLQPFRES